MRILLLVSALLLVSSVGCARPPQATEASGATGPVAAATPAAKAWPLMVVSKSATCGCCTAWVARMREAGFTVEVHDMDNLDAVKTRVGVPVGKGSCHTAEIGGYFVEGHVPADDIKRLLAERPRAKGLVLPGMPPGAPGMELPDGTTQPYTVELVADDGSTRAFVRHGD
jgi:hypothetical protein